MMDCEPFEDGPSCSHESFEVSWEGRAICDHCPATWWATPAEWRGYEAMQRRLDREWRRYNSWWMRAWRWISDRLRRRPSLTIDDDLPF